jgi:ZIP family zinc transporter
MIQGGAVSLVAVVAIFLSNIPEGLSSAAGMKKAGRSASMCSACGAAYL